MQSSRTTLIFILFIALELLVMLAFFQRADSGADLSF
jgi:hypothetical protein